MKYFSILIIALVSLSAFAGNNQATDSVKIKMIFDRALSEHYGINNLKYLTKSIGPRVAGSKNSLLAIKWSKKTLETLGLDTVYVQKCMVANWERKKDEISTIKSRKLGSKKIDVISLGGSISTPENGIDSQIIAVDSISDLQKLGTEKIAGKVVFFRRPMDHTYFRPGKAYGSNSELRVRGASAAAKYGAVAVIVRSLTMIQNDLPHTGIMRYDTTQPRIPAFAVSTNSADTLDKWLLDDPKLSVFLKSTTIIGEDVESANVIGEIKGSLYPDSIIIVGGHLDSWDVGEGAHDDGAGIIHSMESLRILLESGIKPKHTIRCVFFMDEEMNQRGGRKYAELAKIKNEKHLAAIESDGGGFNPSGFGMDASDEKLARFQSWVTLFKPYGVREFTKGGGGVDISFLKSLNVPLIGLSNDSQIYFDFHHSANDVLENVHERELQLGSAYIAALIYLLDKYGL